jgi:hypothetical protein
LGHRFTSLLLVALLCEPAAGQAFGRFGFSPYPELPGWRIDREGLRAKHPASDQLRFAEPLRRWQPVETTEFQQIALTGGGAGNPAKIRASLLQFGPSLYYEAGIELRLSCTASPYLSWEEGTVEAGVPTPERQWLLLSFRDRQPPILIVFEGAPAALRIVGKPGDWSIRTVGVYRGWVRFSLPFGTQATEANTAAGLGRLVQRVKAEPEIWLGPGATASQTKTVEKWSAVEAEVRFSRAFVPLPQPIDLAPLGGYPLRVLSKARKLDIQLDGVPVWVSEENRLLLRLPVRRVPTGRGVGVGARSFGPPATVSPIDVPSVAELAWENLISFRDRKVRELSEKTMADYLAQAPTATEPWTRQTMLYAEDGKGMDILAAQALLMQAMAASNQISSEANSFLTSLVWRRDWWTWRIWGPGPALARRTAALASLAAALCPEPERRLEAALLHAGLAAERGKAIREARARGEEDPSLPEPYFEIRRHLFGGARSAAEESPFVRLLLSEIRVYGDAAFEASAAGERRVALRWTAEESSQSTIVLASGFPLKAENGNLAGFKVEQGLGFTRITVRPKGPGPCEFFLDLPDYAPPIPAFVDPPAYDEAPRSS